MAAFTAEAFLVPSRSINARFVTRGHDLVGVGFGADRQKYRKVCIENKALTQTPFLFDEKLDINLKLLNLQVLKYFSFVVYSVLY